MNTNQSEIILIFIIVGVVLILLSRLYTYLRSRDFHTFIKKYELENYQDGFLELRLNNIANSESTSDQDKVKALKLLKEYYHTRLIGEAKSKVDEFINKYNFNTKDDIEKVYNQLKEISQNKGNPKEDIDFANQMMKSLKSNK